MSTETGFRPLMEQPQQQLYPVLPAGNQNIPIQNPPHPVQVQSTAYQGSVYQPGPSTVYYAQPYQSQLPQQYGQPAQAQGVVYAYQQGAPGQIYTGQPMMYAPGSDNQTPQMVIAVPVGAQIVGQGSAPNTTDEKQLPLCPSSADITADRKSLAYAVMFVISLVLITAWWITVFNGNTKTEKHCRAFNDWNSCSQDSKCWWLPGYGHSENERCVPSSRFGAITGLAATGVAMMFIGLIFGAIALCIARQPNAGKCGSCCGSWIVIPLFALMGFFWFVAQILVFRDDILAPIGLNVFAFLLTPFYVYVIAKYFYSRAPYTGCCCN